MRTPSSLYSPTSFWSRRAGRWGLGRFSAWRRAGTAIVALLNDHPAQGWASERLMGMAPRLHGHAGGGGLDTPGANAWGGAWMRGGRVGLMPPSAGWISHEQRGLHS